MIKEIENILDEMWDEEIKINLMKTIEQTIIKAKKEVFDDIDNLLDNWNCRNDEETQKTLNTIVMRTAEIKQRHLSTFSKKKETNNRFKKDGKSIIK